MTHPLARAAMLIVLISDPLGLLAGQAGSVQSPPGTGLIVGQVVDAQGRPVDGAIVSINTPGGRVADRQAVRVDASGRYLFRNLAKGTYVLTADCDGYISGAYGRNLPTLVNSGLGQTASTVTPRLDLVDGERLTGVTIRLWKYASLAGRVVDESGEPFVGVTVRALVKTVLGGHAAFTPNTAECGGACMLTKTDDLGAFQFVQLFPGDYIVVVPTVTSAAPTSLQRLVAANPNLRVPAFFDSSVAAMDWLGGGGTVAPVSSGMRGPNDRVSIGDVSRSVPIASLKEDGRLAIYPTQFYPSAMRVADATVLTLASGDDRSDINMRLRPMNTVTVSGTLMSSTGPMSDFLLRLVPADQDLLERDPEIATTVSDVDGGFTFVGVPPGDYWIRMLRRPITPSAPSVVSANVQSAGGSGIGVVAFNADAQPLPPADPVQFANARVSVGDTDVRGVAVTMHEAARLSGRIEFTGASARPARMPAIGIERADGHRSVNVGSTLTRSVPDGRFASQGLVPGQYLIARPSDSAPWYFRSAMYQGRDVSLEPLEMAGVDITGLVITYADTPWTTVSGTVTLESGAPAAQAVVLIFPSDSKRWSSQGRSPRQMGRAGTGLRGTFTFVNLPPGDYLAIAITSSDDREWQDVEVLKRLSQAATRVSLQEGQPATIRLTGKSWPQ